MTRKTAQQLKDEYSALYVGSAIGNVSSAAIRQTTLDMLDSYYHLDADFASVLPELGLHYTLEEFGGRGNGTLDNFKQITSATLTRPSTNPNTFRFGNIPQSSFTANWAPTGASVWVRSTDPAANPANLGHFWVETVSDGSNFLQVINPGGVPQSGVTYTISYLDPRISLMKFLYDADGNPATTPFDNYDAFQQLVATAVTDLYQGPRDLAIIIELGPNAYPTSGGHDLLGISNLTLCGQGRSSGGLYWLDGSCSARKPHLLYVDQPVGNINTMTFTAKEMFFFANRDSHFPDWGDFGRAGTGDLLHFYQKASGDYSAAATRFDNFVMGVDPQFLIENCVLSGGPRHNIALRGRGDTHINDNIIQRAGINNVRLDDFQDSKFNDNIMTASGENCIRIGSGANNIQMVGDVYYFNGNNSRSLLEYNDGPDLILERLATVWASATNIKIHSKTRLEDSAGPAIFAGKQINLIIDADFNSIGSMGPTGSDRTEITPSLNGLISGTDWYGVDGVPAILAAADETSIMSIDAKMLIRTGRDVQAVNTILSLGRGTAEQVFKDINLDLVLGRNQNDPGNPRLDDGDWADFFPDGINHFQYYLTFDDTTYHVPYQNVRVTVDGLPVDQFHAKPRRAWFADEINKQDRLVVVETAVPVKFDVTSLSIPSAGRARFTSSTDVTSVNQGRIFQPIEAFGFASAANVGRWKVVGRNTGSNYFDAELPGAVAEASPVGAYVMFPAYGVYPVVTKPAGTRTIYWAKALGKAANGYLAKARFTGLGGDVAAFELTRTNERVTTVVDGLGREQLVATAQTETLGDANYVLKPTDFGKTLVVPASAARALSALPAASYPADWFCWVMLDGTGSLTIAVAGTSGITNGTPNTTRYQTARFVRSGGQIIRTPVQ